MSELQQTIGKVESLKAELINLLAQHETSKERLVGLEQTVNSLQSINLQQDELFRQSLRCMKHDLFRASHVMAWAGFIDWFLDKLSSDNFRKLKAERPKWKFNSKSRLTEIAPEHQIIEASKVTGLCTNSEMKGLLGLLNTRNECAHPSSYFPEFNESLGYFSQLMTRINTLDSKPY